MELDVAMGENINSIDSNRCTGCSVCATLCSKKAITMQEAEDGFLYPIIDSSLCVSCGVCYDNCHTAKENKKWFEDKVFAGHYTDPVKLSKSSSGGAASAISELVINSGGVVYGVAFSEDYKQVLYSSAYECSELEKFKTSKYSQAMPPNYEEIRDHLNRGTLVCFIGLPCQCDALRCYLNRDYDNLLLVSLVCHGPTSPKVHRLYIEEIESRYGLLQSIVLRYKRNGNLRPTYINCEFKSGKRRLLPFNTSSYGLSFELLNRVSCSECHAKYPNGVSDIIVGDFWGGKDRESKQSEKGESMIILRNQNFEDLIQNLRDVGFLVEKASADDLPNKNPCLFNSIPINLKRGSFVNDMSEYSLAYATKHNTSSLLRFKKRLYFLIRRLIPKRIWKLLR